MTSNRSLLTAEEVAEEFLVDAGTVHRWAREGKIDAIKLPGGRLRRFRREDIELIVRGEQAPALDPDPEVRSVTVPDEYGRERAAGRSAA